MAFFRFFAGEPWCTRIENWNEGIRKMGDLKNKLEQRRMNTKILIIGDTFSGKSSFVNSVFSVYHDCDTMIAPVGNSTRGTTKTFISYRLPEWHLELIDTAGLGKETKDDDFNNIVSIIEGKKSIGKLQDGGLSLVEESDKQQYDKNRVHAVLYVCDGTSNEENIRQKVSENIQRIQDELTKKVMPLIVLMTKIDGISRRFNIRNIFYDNDIKDKVTLMHKVMHVPMSSILPMQNRTLHEGRKDEQYFLTICNILEMTKVAENYMNQIVDLQVLTDMDIRGSLWRETNLSWSEEELDEFKKDIEKFKPLDGIPRIRILLLGKVSAGKSSLINTMHAALIGRTSTLAPSGTVAKSVTSDFTPYQLLNSPIEFVDSKGLEESKQEDIDAIVSLIENRTEIKIQRGGRTQKEEKKSSTPDRVANRIHCVVFVIPATENKDSLSSFLSKSMFSSLRERLSEMGLQHTAIITKVDKVVSNLNLKGIFHRKEIQSKIAEITQILGLPGHAALPMRNISDEVYPDIHTRILALHNLKRLLDIANDYIQRCHMKEREDDSIGSENWKSAQESK